MSSPHQRLTALLRRLAKEGDLDEESLEELVELIDTRPLDHTTFSEVHVAVSSGEARPERSHIVTATGLAADGSPEPLGVTVTDQVDRSFWEGFLLSVRHRGLRGVSVLSVERDDPELSAAAARVFPDVGWSVGTPPWLDIDEPSPDDDPPRRRASILDLRETARGQGNDERSSGWDLDEGTEPPRWPATDETWVHLGDGVNLVDDDRSGAGRANTN